MDKKMKNKDFVILCLRLLGIYFVVIGLGSYARVVALLVESENVPISVYLAPNVYVICGCILFFAAPGLSSFIVSFSEADDEKISISPSEKTARIALLVLGIYILTYALPQFIRVAIDVGLYYKDLDKIAKELREVRAKWTYLIGPVIQLAIAAILIVGPDKIVGLLAKYDTTFKRIKSSEKSPE